MKLGFQNIFELIVLALMAFAVGGAAAQTNQESFAFARRELALPVQRAGMFIGQSGGVLIAGGGLDERGQPSAEVFVRTNSGWEKLNLSDPVAFGGFISGTFAEKIGGVSRLFVVGGINQNGLTDKAFSLEWRGGRLLQQELPPLPLPLALAGVGCF